MFFRLVAKYCYRLFYSVNYCWLVLLPGLFLSTISCNPLPPGDARDELTESETAKPVAVDVAVARQASLEQSTEYIGTTFPVREVALRSRIEGQILTMTVDVGDRVEQGQQVARIDDTLAVAAVAEAEAELAALQSEVASLEADVNDARARVDRAELELKQAKSDASRTDRLFRQGAISEQEAEIDRTAVGTAEQTLQSARQQVENRSSVVKAALRRVAAQEAIVAQERQRQSFTVLTSPVTGSVLERVLEPGDLAQPGDEVLRLGDFSQIQVRVQISELELANVREGQSAQVRLDAFPDRAFTGEVTQISLAADATARLVPIEVTIPNRERRIGRGLLARVNFSQENDSAVIVPETAIEVAENTDTANTATIFVLNRTGEQPTVTARSVQLGDRANSQVEVLTGLEPGTELIVRSSGNLQDGDPVRLSFISESSSPEL